ALSWSPCSGTAGSGRRWGSRSQSGPCWSARRSEADRLERDAAALGRGLQTGFGQLHAAGGREQVVAVLAAGEHVAQELLPLGLEAVVQVVVGRYLEPLVAERLGGRQVRVPHRLRGVRTLLGHAVAQ